MGDMEFTFENSMDWNGTTDATQSLAENYAYLARIPLPYSPVGQSWPNFYTKQMKGWRLTKVGYPGSKCFTYSTKTPSNSTSSTRKPKDCNATL